MDMSPAPAAGTMRGQPAQCTISDSSLDSLWRNAPGQVQVQVSGVVLVPGLPRFAAASLEMPRSLLMPPGRHQFASQSPGRVCGTERSGVWVPKGDARTYSPPENLDDVGVVWEHASGCETAGATPGHGCSS